MSHSLDITLKIEWLVASVKQTSVLLKHLNKQEVQHTTLANDLNKYFGRFVIYYIFKFENLYKYLQLKCQILCTTLMIMH